MEAWDRTKALAKPRPSRQMVSEREYLIGVSSLPPVRNYKLGMFGSCLDWIQQKTGILGIHIHQRKRVLVVLDTQFGCLNPWGKGPMHFRVAGVRLGYDPQKRAADGEMMSKKRRERADWAERAKEREEICDGWGIAKGVGWPRERRTGKVEESWAFG